ncbi:MAG: hypothetical protein ACKO96_31735, partial [Flammeovirgaceae bacterium]
PKPQNPLHNTQNLLKIIMSIKSNPRPFGTSSYSILFGTVNLAFPNWPTTESHWRVPMTEHYIRMQFPGAYFATLFYLGIGALGYFTAKRLACFYKRTSTYFKSFGNAKKY